MKKIFTYLIPCLVLILSGNTGLFSQTGHLKANNDTIDLVPGIGLTVNLLANDTIPAGDSVRVVPQFPTNILHSGVSGQPGTYVFTARWGFNGNYTGKYFLWNVKDTSIMDTSFADILFRVRDHSYDSLEINNINARFDAKGNNFLGTNGGCFEVPRGSGKHTIYNSVPWIGGLGQDSTLYFANDQFANLTGFPFPDYHAGPLMDTGNYSIYQDTLWNRVWKLRRSDISYHLAHFRDPGYHPIAAIATWPGNGNVSLGQMQEIAPFFDANGNHLYEPMQGDYPLIRGDEAIFFVFNDDDHRAYYPYTKMKIEVHAMAYVFDLPEDSAFKNAIFVNYQVFNRSQRTYYRTAIGMYTDFDIGNYSDDYIGCDVQRSSFYGYNADSSDGSGLAGEYGAHPPAQAVTILGGLRMDPDGIDNPKKDGAGHQLCSESINGMNFGDSIVDNERLGMGFSSAWSNSVLSGTLYPEDCYRTIYNQYYDSLPVNYGGWGQACKYSFPGKTDTLSWGTACTAPYGRPPSYPDSWTMKSYGVFPGDYRALGSSGPFTFHPGDVQEFDVAYIWARDYTGNDSMPSVTKLGQMIDTIRNAWINNKLPNGETFNEGIVHPPASSGRMKLYPNPAFSKVTIDFGKPLREETLFTILSAGGEIVYSQKENPNGNTLSVNVSGFPSGVYLVRVSGREIMTAKLVIIR
jgi:hypothetical protein